MGSGSLGVQSVIKLLRNDKNKGKSLVLGAHVLIHDQAHKKWYVYTKEIKVESCHANNN